MMLSRITTIAVAIFISLCFASAGFAQFQGNDRKGKYTYRKIYKACNERGEVDSSKPTLSPDAKTMAQWKRVYDKKDFEQFGCKQEWQQLDEKDLEDIFTYLYNHAADSPTPAKCK